MKDGKMNVYNMKLIYKMNEKYVFRYIKMAYKEVRIVTTKVFLSFMKLSNFLENLSCYSTVDVLFEISEDFS